ncbi:MAG: ATP-binding protein [Bacteroidota bacterium]
MATKLLDTPPETAFDRVTRLVARLLKVPVSLVSLVDHDRQFFKSVYGVPAPWARLRETPLTHSFCQHVVQANAPLTVDDAREHPLVHANLAVSDFNIVAYLGVPIHTPDGHPLGTLCAIDHQPRAWSPHDHATLQDLAEFIMTELDLRHTAQAFQRQKAAFKAQREALQRKQDLVNHFAQLASHDLQEPLRTVTSFSQVLKQRHGEALGEEGQELLGFMLDGTAHMRDLLHGLRALHDVEKRPLEPHRVDPNVVLGEVFRALAENQPLPQHALTLSPLPVVWAESGLMFDLLYELIDNCFKFAGTEPLRLSIQAKIVQGRVRFVISDNGIGIDPAYGTRIFELFRRLHTRACYPGMGVGLAVCKHIVERFGGRIWASPNARSGLTVSFELPQQPPLT